MILSEVRQAIRTELDDMEFDGAKIDLAINFFQNQLYNDNRIAAMETSTNLTPVQGATSIALPATLQLLTNLTVTVPSVYSIWKNFLEQQDFELKYPGFDVYAQQNLYEWTLYGRSVRFSAPLLANTTVRADFVRRPVKVVNDGDTLEIPDNYLELAVLGGKARVMEMNEDYAEAAQERNNLEPLVTTFVRNEGRGGVKAGPTIMRTNRRRQTGLIGE